MSFTHLGLPTLVLDTDHALEEIVPTSTDNARTRTYRWNVNWHTVLGPQFPEKGTYKVSYNWESSRLSAWTALAGSDAVKYLFWVPSRQFQCSLAMESRSTVSLATYMPDGVLNKFNAGYLGSTLPDNPMYYVNGANDPVIVFKEKLQTPEFVFTVNGPENTPQITIVESFLQQQANVATGQTIAPEWVYDFNKKNTADPPVYILADQNGFITGSPESRDRMFRGGGRHIFTFELLHA